MARCFGLLVLLAVSLGSVASSPVEEQTILPGVPGDKRWDWNDCGTSSHVVRIESIAVKPDPPVRGEELTITVLGKASEAVEEGAYVDVTVKAGPIRLLRKEFDICEEARNANTTIQCPVEEGSHKVIQSVTLPREIPPAQFKVEARGYTVDDRELLCLDLMMDFRPKRLW